MRRRFPAFYQFEAFSDGTHWALWIVIIATWSGKQR